MNSIKRNHLRSLAMVMLAGFLVLGAVGCSTTKAPRTAEPPQTPDEDKPPVGPGRNGEAVEEGALQIVYFDYDKSMITSEAAAKLRENAAWMKDHSGADVRVEGHCDNRGSDQYNMALGERRALAVRNFLIGEGIDGNRLYTISYGESRPAIPNAQTEAQHAKNRRAEFKVIQSQ